MNYIVKRGDTLTKIAVRFSTTVKRIAADNNIANVNKIYAGQTLTINSTNTSQPSFSTDNPLALMNNEQVIPAGSGLRLPQNATVSVDDSNSATNMINDAGARIDYMPFIMLGGGLLLLIVLMNSGGSSGVTRAKRRK